MAEERFLPPDETAPAGPAPLLSADEVAGVLSGMSTERTESGDAVTALPYSIREPVAIPPEAETAARERIGALAGALTEALAREIDAPVGLEIDGFQQQRAHAILSALPSPAWILAFARPGGGGAALVLHPGLAMAMVEAALGGTGKPPEAHRAPTAAERRTLSRVAAALARPLGSAMGSEFASASVEVGRVPQAVASAGETVGVGLLRMRLAESERAALLMVTPALLTRGVAQEETVDWKPGPLAKRLEKVRFDVRPVLSAGRVSLSDVSKLHPGAVLRLDAPTHTEFVLHVADQPVFRGRIDRSETGAAFAATWRRGRPGSEKGGLES